MDLKLKLCFSLQLHIVSTDGARLQEQMSLIVSNAFLFFFLHSSLYLYLFERLNRLSAVFMAYGIAALRGLHHPLTINEMWHANLWLEAQVMINAFIHKLPSWFTANHPDRCTGHHCLAICISGKIVWNKVDIQQSDIYNPPVCMCATHQTTCKNV